MKKLTLFLLFSFLISISSWAGQPETILFIKTYARSAYVTGRYIVNETPMGRGKEKTYKREYPI